MIYTFISYKSFSLHLVMNFVSLYKDCLSINKILHFVVHQVMLGGTFDVQSIMDKVQEMRRHLENSDSESDDDGDWIDDDDY